MVMIRMLCWSWKSFQCKLVMRKMSQVRYFKTDPLNWIIFIVTLVDSLFSVLSFFSTVITPNKGNKNKVSLYRASPLSFWLFTCWQCKASLVSFRVETSLLLSARVRVTRKRKLIWMKIKQRKGYLSYLKRSYVHFQVHIVILGFYYMSTGFNALILYITIYPLSETLPF